MHLQVLVHAAKSVCCSMCCNNFPYRVSEVLTVNNCNIISDVFTYLENNKYKFGTKDISKVVK